MRPTALVMNMFYTGLGIARSLGEEGIPVLGLSAHRGVYGEYTRYAKIVSCPDSRKEPGALLTFLARVGKESATRNIIFPTRDDDLVFLDRFREELSAYFEIVAPPSPVLQAALNKWDTYLWAQRAGVPTPRCWLVRNSSDIHQASGEITYPCVIKPVSSHHWRKGNNWEKVGGCKAVIVNSPEQLGSTYESISRAEKRVLLQEMIPGSDADLWITACYLDRESRLVASFNTHKLLQVPEGVGTGCIVEAAEEPALLDPTVKLLQEMRFSGIAEVEYKWDREKQVYQLIEINPRPWDQHRLGNQCGVNLMQLAYCEHAGLPMPVVHKRISRRKWIAEDAYLVATLGFAWNRNPKLGATLQLARGERCFAIWSAKDPAPAIVYSVRQFIPGLMQAWIRVIWSKLKMRVSRGVFSWKRGLAYSSYWNKGKSHG